MANAEEIKKTDYIQLEDEYGKGVTMSIAEFKKALEDLAEKLKDINDNADKSKKQKEKREQDILDTLNSIENPY